MLLACRCEYANLHDYPHIQSSNNRPLTHLVGSKLMTAHTEAGLAPTFLFIKAIDTNLFRSQLTSQAPLSRLPTRPTSLTPTGVALRGRCRDIQMTRATWWVRESRVEPQAGVFGHGRSAEAVRRAWCIDVHRTTSGELATTAPPPRCPRESPSGERLNHRRQVPKPLPVTER